MPALSCGYAITPACVEIMNRQLYFLKSRRPAVNTQYGEGAPQHIEVLQTDPMKNWASYRDGDIGWTYVTIVGNDYSEAVALIYCSEDGQPKIRSIEWGRP